MECRYINLDARPDRLAAMEGQFAALGLPAIRVPALTPADLSAADRQAYCNPRRIRWLHETELACALSHRRALAAFLAGSAPALAVFEDDVMLSAALPEVLGLLARGLPDGTGLVRLETDNRGVRLDPRPDVALGRFALHRAWGPTSGTAGYVVSRAAARLILSDRRFLRVPADQSLFNPYEGLARRAGMRHLVPAVCAQWDRLGDRNAPLSQSDIEAGRRSRGGSSGLAGAVRSVHDLLERELIVGPRQTVNAWLRGARKRVVPLV